MTEIHTLISVALIWWLFAFLWRDYRIDKCRQNLFAIRDELFDFANEDNISFRHPAYGMLRSTINGSIQYSHRVGLLEFLFFGFIGRTKNSEELTGRFTAKWRDALSDLDEPTRKQMLQFRHRVHLVIVEQVVFTSFLLVFTAFALVLFVLLKLMGTTIRDLVYRVVNRVVKSRIISAIVESMDATAHTTASH